MIVRVRLFAMCRDAAGKDLISLELPAETRLQDVWSHLLRVHPELARYRDVSRIARNMEYAMGNEMIRDGDELSVIPPVSGG